MPLADARCYDGETCRWYHCVLEQITCCALWWILKRIRRTLTYKRRIVQLHACDLKIFEMAKQIGSFDRHFGASVVVIDGVAHHTNMANLPPRSPPPSSSQASASARRNTYTYYVTHRLDKTQCKLRGNLENINLCPPRPAMHIAQIANYCRQKRMHGRRLGSFSTR